MDEHDLVLVYEASSEVESVIYRTVLQEAGIDVTITRGGRPMVPGDVFRTQGAHYLLLVQSKDAEQARQAITEHQAAAGATGENEGEEEPVPAFSSRRWVLLRIVIAAVAVVLVLILISVIPQLLR